MNAPRSRTARWYLLTNTLRDSFFPCLILINSIMSSSGLLPYETALQTLCTFAQNYRYFLVTTLSYHSRTRPSNVIRKALHLCIVVKPCTLVILLKHWMCTNGLLFPENFLSGKRKTLEIVMFIISTESGGLLSNMILQLEAFSCPHISSMV